MSDRNALQSFLATYGQNDVASIPHVLSQCCCGNEACAYLKRNQTALSELEEDVRNSARLGQALLVRHETYMADAEKQRISMTAQLEEAEFQKDHLQRKNDGLVKENRTLLDQLEAMNSSVSESDAHIASLQATLHSAQQEIHKLSQLAARTEKLELDLSLFETDQLSWQATLTAREEAEKSAVRRWQDAERTLVKLHQQLERIEREAGEEKDRHAEVVARMERRHAVETELGSAADRLKGLATNKESGGSTVVSHFVKDILQDNATLQLGIVELRELLQVSNEEVEKLRDELLLHQPANEEEEDRPAINRSVSLNDELTQAQAQELHVHHHYHAPSSRTTNPRRPKKKRYSSFSNAHFSSTSSGRSTPSSSVSLGAPSSMAAILQQTTVSVPQTGPSGKRFSAPLNLQTQSVCSASGPSSPTSTTRYTSSIFDRPYSDAGHDSSSPTTSDGEAYGSPEFTAAGSKRYSTPALRNYNASYGHTRGLGSVPGKHSLDSILDTSIEDLPPLDNRQADHGAIAEESEADGEDSLSPSTAKASSTTFSPTASTARALDEHPWSRPTLRRAASHESLISISGMDIHTLQERPSQLLISHAGPGATVSSFQAHAARPGVNTGFQGSSRSILSGMAADLRRQPPPKQTLTTKASTWIFGRWGASAKPTTTAPSPPATRGSDSSSAKPPSLLSHNSDSSITPTAVKLRPPGINQPGPILGFAPEMKTQHAPVMKTLDQAALTKLLDE